MTCKDCIHYDICIFHPKGNENEKCAHFKIKADFVKVVRCKDCKHITGTKLKCSKFENIQMSKWHYCSYGEKKE